ncbi:hypothetical protein GCM10007904_06490 [Oharaeibacter diazotrophicus]|nr:hypothetical protein GCM10007904_06490 [Oharaeibacter diazotrophicus]
MVRPGTRAMVNFLSAASAAPASAATPTARAATAVNSFLMAFPLSSTWAAVSLRGTSSRRPVDDPGAAARMAPVGRAADRRRAMPAAAPSQVPRLSPVRGAD